MISEASQKVIQEIKIKIDRELRMGGAQVRDRMVIPFCQKYGFRFVVRDDNPLFIRLEDNQPIFHRQTRLIYYDFPCDATPENPKLKTALEINDRLAVLEDLIDDGPLGDGTFDWTPWLEEYDPS